MKLQQMLFQLPSIARFIGDIIDDCLDNKSVVAVVPPQLDVFESEFLIRQTMSEKGLAIAEIVLDDLEEKQPPTALIGSRFPIKWIKDDCPMTVEYLLESTGLPENILLSGFGALPEDEKPIWIDFINNWSRIPLGVGNRGIRQKPSLCVILSGKDFFPGLFDSVPQLSVRHWFGFPSALEIRVLCRYATVYYNDKTKEKWCEYLIPSLAETDLVLADSLWDIVVKPVNEISSFFLEDALNKGWTKLLLQKWGAARFTDGKDRDIDIGQALTYYPDLLLNGALCCTMEYGTELHTSAMAVLGHCDQLKKRMWRGQVSMLLPAIDTIRLYICDRLTDNYGFGWPLSFPPKEPEELRRVTSNPRACQLGHLLYTIQSHCQFAEERKYLPLVKRAKEIRNELAHYRPVNFTDYQTLAWEAGKFGLRI